MPISFSRPIKALPFVRLAMRTSQPTAKRAPYIACNPIAEGKIEKVAPVTGIRRVQGAFGEWFGLDAGGAPLLLRNTGNQQIYALDWQAP